MPNLSHDLSHEVGCGIFHLQHVHAQNISDLGRSACSFIAAPRGHLDDTPPPEKMRGAGAGLEATAGQVVLLLF